MAKITTIRVTDKTKQRLRAIQHSPSETYESIILRLLETKVGGDLVEYLVYDAKCKNCWIKIAIDWSNPMNSIQFLNRDGTLSNSIPKYNYESSEEQELWDNFREDLEELNNIRSMCAILETGQVLHLGTIGIKRL